MKEEGSHYISLCFISLHTNVTFKKHDNSKCVCLPSKINYSLVNVFNFKHYN